MPRIKYRQSGLVGLPITVLIILLDYATKLAAVHYLKAYSPKAIFAGFNLTLAFNRGSAFSFLANQSGWQVGVLSALAIVVSIVLLGWLARIPRESTCLVIALNCIIGGAIGNLIDRLLYGHVVDFLDFYVKSWHWPAFNVADSAICIGAVLLLFSQFSADKGGKK